MLLHQIVDKKHLFGESNVLEICTDSLIVIKDGESYQIPYEDIKNVSLLTRNKKDYLLITYAGGDKSNEQNFVIGNIQSPQIILKTIMEIVKKERAKFAPIRISYD